jgi:signal transduction histidine kinase
VPGSRHAAGSPPPGSPPPGSAAAGSPSGAGPLLRAALAARDRYLAWPRRHPLVVDSALVAVLVLLSHPPLAVGHPGRPAWSWALVAGLLLPLVWRRRAPFAVFLIIAAAAFVQWLVARPLPADLSLLIAFYTIAAYQSGRRILVAAGLLEVGAALASMTFAPSREVFWSFVFITGTMTAAGSIGYYIRTRRAYLAALVDRAARLERERDQQARLAASAERARIAREMHDVVAHNLAVMIALADGAAYTVQQDPVRAGTVMSQVSATGRSALTDMRRLLGVMRDPGTAADDPAGSGPAPQPTLAELDDLLATVGAAGLPVRLSESGSRAAAPPAAQLAAYRIVQESLTNALKHARATAARVRISYQPQAVELEITDNGQASPAASAEPGHGIAGMGERAALFGGTVSAGPRPGGGWRVHAMLHLNPAPAPEPAARMSPVIAEGT